MVPPFSQHLEPQLRIPPLWLSSFQVSQFKRPCMERSLTSLGTAWSCQVSVLAPVLWGLEEVAGDLGSGHTSQCTVPQATPSGCSSGEQSPSEGAHLSRHLLHRPLEENVLESWAPHRHLDCLCSIYPSAKLLFTRQSLLGRHAVSILGSRYNGGSGWY